MSGLHEQSRVVGKRIAVARQRAGLLIGDLATRIGWPRDTLVNYELGRRAITIERLHVIAEALQVSPAILLLDDNRLSEVVGSLIAKPALLSHVQFFLDTLQDDAPSDPMGMR